MKSKSTGFIDKFKAAGAYSRRAWNAFQVISKIWSSRVRGLKVERFALAIAILSIISIGFGWILHLSASLVLEEPTGVPSVDWLTDTALDLADIAQTVGELCLILLALSLIGYSLIAIQAWLPGFLSFLLTAGIATSSLWFIDVKRWLVQQLVYLLPYPQRPMYDQVVDDWFQFLTCFIFFGSLVITILTCYVYIRGTVSILRDEARFLRGKWFKDWSTPVQPILKFPPFVWRNSMKPWAAAAVSGRGATANVPNAAAEKAKRAARKRQGNARKKNRQTP